MAPRPWLPALLLVLLTAALPGPAAGQAQPCTLTASVEPATAEHAPGEALGYNFTVLAGPLGGTVEAQVERATAGWNATLAEAGFALAAGASRTVGVVVQAPGDRNVSVASIVLAARLTCTAVAGSPALGTADARQTLSPFLAQLPPPAAPAAGPGAGIALLGLVGVVLLGAGLALARRAQPLTLEAPSPRRDVPPGGGAAFPLVLANRGRAALLVRVEVGEAPAGWSLVKPSPEVPLEPGASSQVQVLVRSPQDARPGDAATLEVQAKAPGARPAAVLLRAFVVGSTGGAGGAEGRGPGGEPPRPPAPARPGRAPLRPAVVVRDEAVLERERKREGPSP